MAKIIFRWDLDKTYLKTDFDKVSSLLKTFFQAPEKRKPCRCPSAFISFNVRARKQSHFLFRAALGRCAKSCWKNSRSMAFK